MEVHGDSSGSFCSCGTQALSFPSRAANSLVNLCLSAWIRRFDYLGVLSLESRLIPASWLWHNVAMSQTKIPAVFLRGGSSKGVFFHGRDLPESREARDPIFLSALGSPDPYGRQLDGMGGGISSLSKAVVIDPATRDDADVNYTFAQIGVDQPVVDYGSTCGNLSSAVGPFAVDEGLVDVSDGEALVRIFNTCLLYTSPSPRDGLLSRMPSSA